MEDYCVEHEFQEYNDCHYCNYPEVSKLTKKKFHNEEEQYCNDSSSSSGLPSCTSAVSDIRSVQKEVFCEETPSLTNFLKLSFSSAGDSKDLTEGSENSEFYSSGEEEVEVLHHTALKGRGSQKNPLNHIDPEGWIKYASDPDPWNENYYTETVVENIKFQSSTLTKEDIFHRTCNLVQLPDTKKFVFSRLHIKKMDLEDISVLSNYRHFMYIDMSWNLISDLNGLSNCQYLIYLNVSHNKISKVLDFKPPWFLTHVTLCCNEIREIGSGNLSEFWSLRHLDLSYNLIEKIEGLEELSYLTYVNLSHNFITTIENLHCPSLLELDLSFNKIQYYSEEEECFENIKELRELNLAHNSLTTLHHFDKLLNLIKLDMSDNQIMDISKICMIEELHNLKDLKFSGNKICSVHGYREVLVFKLKSLSILDSVPVDHQERVAARMLWEPNLFTKKIHLRAKIEFWNQLATQTMDADTLPYDEPPIPLVVLVGTFACNKKEIANKLASEFPDQVYRCSQFTTAHSTRGRYDDNLILVSVDEFNEMIKSGKLLFYYKEASSMFGVGIEQLSTCVLEGKIGIIETTLDGALVLRSLGRRPYLVLCIYENVEKYEKKLCRMFSGTEVGSSFLSYGCRKRASSRKSFVGLVHFDEEEEEEEEEEEREESLVTEENEEEGEEEEEEEVTSIPTFMLSESSSSSKSEWVASSLMFLDKRWLGNVNTSPKEDSINEDNKRTTTIKSRRMTRTKLSDRRMTDDEFVWEWTYEPSIVDEPDISESHQSLLRGQEMFVRNTLQQQRLYVEFNQANPGVFTCTVSTDDFNNAMKKVEQVCCDAFNQRGNLKKIETILDKPASKKFIEARVQSLMKELINVPAGI